MKMQSNVNKLALGIIGLTAGVAMNVQAERYGETIVSTSAQGIRTATVEISDLDIASTAGFETLGFRIQNAARVVCGPADYRRAGSLKRARVNRECATAAFDDAMSQISGAGLASVSVSNR